MNQQHVGPRVHLREVNEIGHRVVLDVGVQAMRHSVLAHASLDDGVTICRHLDGAIGADNAPCATDVLDDHRLFQDFGQFFRHQAAHDIAGAAGWKGHDQFDRFIRVIRLGQGFSLAEHGQTSEADHAKKLAFIHHMCLLLMSHEKNEI